MHELSRRRQAGEAAHCAAGRSLAELSIEELKARITLYTDEIKRLEAEISAKEKHMKAAESFFRR